MKVLMLGDSPLIKTGFGRVQRKAAEAFLNAGWEVASVTAHVHEPSWDPDLPIKTIYPPPSDLLGVLSVEGAVEEFKPDRIYLTGDPGTLTNYSTVIPKRIPVFATVPIEGEPIVNHYWREILRAIPFMTVSRYGQEVVYQSLDRKVDFAYHGVDPIFKPLDPARRDEIREQLGWTDKFVLNCTATNVFRKQWPRLLEALAKLKHHYKQKDIILYAHTVPFDNYWLEGWNLPELTAAFGVYEEVLFNPSMHRHLAQIPEAGSDNGVPTLPELYAASDLFVLPSQVEGFGLPIAESMACGTPPLVTRYAAGWEVAASGGAGITVKDWSYHKSGTKYANVDPDSIVKEVLRLKRNRKQLAALSRASIERAKDFDWADFQRKVVDGTASAETIREDASGSAEKAPQHPLNADAAKSPATVR